MGREHPINQPQLGQRLCEIRMEKGLTQLELREKSHVSVRTIQRIESGAVTPRTVTIKILLDALGENAEAWFAAKTESERWYEDISPNKMLLTEASDGALKNAITPAWIAGIVYLLMVLMEQGIGAFSDYLNEDYLLMTSVVIVKSTAAISFFLFTRGLLSLSKLFENYLLKVACYLSMIFVPILYLSEVVIILYTLRLDDLGEVLRGLAIVPLGAISVMLGIGLRRLQDGMGKLAKVAGNLELAFGISYLTLVLSFVGFLLLIPLLVVEIVLLAKADQLIKEGQL